MFKFTSTCKCKMCFRCKGASFLVEKCTLIIIEDDEIDSLCILMFINPWTQYFPTVLYLLKKKPAKAAAMKHVFTEQCFEINLEFTI